MGKDEAISRKSRISCRDKGNGCTHKYGSTINMSYGHMSSRLHTKLPVVGPKAVGRLTQLDEPLSPSQITLLVCTDVPSGVALYIHVSSYCRMLTLANAQARTEDCAETNIKAKPKSRHNVRWGVARARNKDVIWTHNPSCLVTLRVLHSFCAPIVPA